MMDQQKQGTPWEHGLLRRDFLKTGLAAGAGLAMSQVTPLRAQSSGKEDPIRLAIIGTGSQGRVLLDAAANIPNLEWKAVCDVWNYSRRYGQGVLRKMGHQVNAYEDYREMLDKEPDLDAVIVASPDFWHAPHTIACLEAGKHVYCEKLMSNSLEDARDMVLASRETGNLLQIGHQRRSNPRYHFARDKILKEAELLGRITVVNGQWNRSASEDIGWPKKYELDSEFLAKYGYKDMHQFRNWRWFKALGGGPISDLGAHQIDVFSWFLQGDPVAVMADGGVDYYDNHEWQDNVMAIYTFNTPKGVARAFYQVQTTTSAGGGYFEYFMGDEGALKMSENPKYTKIFRENNAPDWGEWLSKGYIMQEGETTASYKPWKKQEAAQSDTVDVRETAALSAWDMPVALDKAIHQPHLENFFDAIRHGTPLTCPGEEGYKSAAIVLKVNEAMAAAKQLEFKPEDFVV